MMHELKEMRGHDGWFYGDYQICKVSNLHESRFGADYKASLEISIHGGKAIKRVDTIDEAIAYIDGMTDTTEAQQEQKALKDVRKGEFFTLKPYDSPQDHQVWTKGDYDRSTKTFGCTRFSDFCDERFFKASRMVWVGFTF